MLKSLSSSITRAHYCDLPKAEYSEAWRGSKTGLKTHSWEVGEQKREPRGPTPGPPISKYYKLLVPTVK